MQRLPAELLLEVLQWLSPMEWCGLRRVDTSFMKLTTLDEELWKQAAARAGLPHNRSRRVLMHGELTPDCEILKRHSGWFIWNLPQALPAGAVLECLVNSWNRTGVSFRVYFDSESEQALVQTQKGHTMGIHDWLSCESATFYVIQIAQRGTYHTFVDKIKNCRYEGND